MIFLIFILTLSICSCELSDDNEDCNFFMLPIPDTMYVVTNAGTNTSNGEYYDISADGWNGKNIYNFRNSSVDYHLFYDTTYGWSINQGTLSYNILYYSNIHTEEPPGDISTIWHVLNGILPAPNVKSDIYYYNQLIGNCL